MVSVPRSDESRSSFGCDQRVAVVDSWSRRRIQSIIAFGRSYAAPTLARGSSFDHLGSLGLVPLGYLLGGAMLDLIGATAALVAVASIFAAATFAAIADPSIHGLTPDSSATGDRRPLECRFRAGQRSVGRPGCMDSGGFGPGGSEARQHWTQDRAQSGSKQ
jgi:hypothetical protein